MFSSKKVFFSSQNDNYPIITGQNPYNLPTNEDYILDTCVDLKVDQGNEANFDSAQLPSTDSLRPGLDVSIVGIPSQEKAIIFDGYSIVLNAPLKNSDGSATNFGKEVSISSNLALVSAPDYKHTANSRSGTYPNDTGYVAVYFRFFNKWHQLGTFCSSDMQLAKPNFEESQPKTKFGTFIKAYTGSFNVYYKEENSMLYKGKRYRVQDQDLVPCQIVAENMFFEDIPENARLCDLIVNSGYGLGELNEKSTYYTEPEYSDSSNTHMGRVIGFAQSFYGTSYSKLGSAISQNYSMTRFQYYNGQVLPTMRCVLIGAPGKHPLIPSKKEVIVFLTNFNTGEYKQVKLQGVDDDDGYGKALCGMNNTYEEDFSLIAADNYIKCYWIQYDGLVIPDTQYHTLNLPQGTEILKMQGFKNRFNTTLSLNGKIYFAIYNTHKLITESRGNENPNPTPWESGF